MTYDAEADALYIQLEEALVCRSEHIDDGTLVDFDEHGTVVGIEVIQPAREWPLVEVLDRFKLAADAALMLLAIFEKGKPHPFLPQHRQLATA